MTGPEHYAEAEALLSEYQRNPHAYTELTLMQAQIHATLAAAAAAADTRGSYWGDWYMVAYRQDWQKHAAENE